MFVPSVILNAVVEAGAIFCKNDVDPVNIILFDVAYPNVKTGNAVLV